MRFSLKGVRAIGCFLLLANIISASRPSWTYSFHEDGDDINNVPITWDSSSIKIGGQRVLILSGEFHPFRLPVPDLWLDVMQKIKAMGFSAVSFYLNWALLEGSPGQMRTTGVFNVEDFIKVAAEAGLYLIARPGPYINAEVSGGGFPGWLQRTKGQLRSTAQDYLDATDNYISTLSQVLAKHEISRGGPVILLQPENEYTFCSDYTFTCLEPEYMQVIEDKYRSGGIKIPLINNDAYPVGHFAPGTGSGAADIYGFDYYPFQYGALCSNPRDWDRGLSFPTYIFNGSVHVKQSASTPFAVQEFQGGAPDPWGGVGTDTCANLINEEFVRVFYKSLYSIGIKLLNIYMIYGGTNWGNLGHPLGYTSYDLGSAITEDRQVFREKYSEAKLQASFLKASPSYLNSQGQNGSFGIFTDTNSLVTTPLIDFETDAAFYTIRHSDFTSNSSVNYHLIVPTHSGNVSIPQLNGALTLNGRDSKVHVTNYNIGDFDLSYSSAEIFTWAVHGRRTVLVLYGGSDETHEFAIPANSSLPDLVTTDGDCTSVLVARLNSSVVVNWRVSSTRCIVRFGDRLDVHLLWRNSAYQYWSVDSQASSSSPVIIAGGYLIRAVTTSSECVEIIGDVNTTTTIEVIAGAPSGCSEIMFNGVRLETTAHSNGSILSATVEHNAPTLDLPDFDTLGWKYLDSFPEAKMYDDDAWTNCNISRSNNPRNLTTTTSLYAGDYGYHAGSIVYRGRFVSNGQETNLTLLTQGGAAFGNTVFLNDTCLGSWHGSPADASNQQIFSLHQLVPSEIYVITIVIDHMGLNMNFEVNSESMKAPRGILDFHLWGHSNQSDVSWKMTGNLGGENYQDLSRGPLNEGGLYAERQGFHLPGAPVDDWIQQSPLSQGVAAPGIGFFTTTFDLHVPQGWDVPMSLVFDNQTTNDQSVKNFRCQIFVNGWQFGKYVNNIGPQTKYPIPEGILNHDGPNYLAITLWAQDADGATIPKLKLEPMNYIFSGYKRPALSPVLTGWKMNYLIHHGHNIGLHIAGYGLLISDEMKCDKEVTLVS